VWSEKSSTEYFKELVDKAFENQQVESDEMVSFYLVNLLQRCIEAKHVFNNDEPFAVTFTRAASADLHEQSILFRRIGDLSLYLAGFFADSLSRSLVDVDYYATIGSASYNNLANLHGGRRGRETFSNVYPELAARFLTFTDILTEVSERCRLTSNKNILRLYERWIKTKSELAAKMLRDIGIEPVADFPIEPVQ